MHSWRWFDQWISSSERGVESYLFFLRDRQEVTRVSQWAIREMHPPTLTLTLTYLHHTT